MQPFPQHTLVSDAQVGLLVSLQVIFIYDIETFAAMTRWHFCPRLKYFLALTTSICSSHSTDIQSALQHAISSSRKDTVSLLLDVPLPSIDTKDTSKKTALY
jgi:hypothetical protein